MLKTEKEDFCLTLAKTLPNSKDTKLPSQVAKAIECLKSTKTSKCNNRVAL